MLSTVRQSLTSATLQCLGAFSHANSVSKHVLSVYMYATGSQCQPITLLSHLGISDSYPGIVRMTQTIHEGTSNISNEATAATVDDNAHGQNNSKDNGTKPAKTRKYKMETLLKLSGFMHSGACMVAATRLFAGSYDNINIAAKSAEQIIGCNCKYRLILMRQYWLTLSHSIQQCKIIVPVQHYSLYGKPSSRICAWPFFRQHLIMLHHWKSQTSCIQGRRPSCSSNVFCTASYALSSHMVERGSRNSRPTWSKHSQTQDWCSLYWVMAFAFLVNWWINDYWEHTCGRCVLWWDESPRPGFSKLRQVSLWGSTVHCTSTSHFQYSGRKGRRVYRVWLGRMDTWFVSC